jgi:hypothetical protein
MKLGHACACTFSTKPRAGRPASAAASPGVAAPVIPPASRARLSRCACGPARDGGRRHLASGGHGLSPGAPRLAAQPGQRNRPWTHPPAAWRWAASLSRSFLAYRGAADCGPDILNGWSQPKAEPVSAGKDRETHRHSLANPPERSFSGIVGHPLEQLLDGQPWNPQGSPGGDRNLFKRTVIAHPCALWIGATTRLTWESRADSSSG